VVLGNDALETKLTYRIEQRAAIVERLRDRPRGTHESKLVEHVSTLGRSEEKQRSDNWLEEALFDAPLADLANRTKCL
jgi:hypothetical protein